MESDNTYPVDEQLIQRFIEAGLTEDVGDGDHTSLACIPAESRSRARLLVKDEGVLAGVELARRIFAHVDPEMEMDIQLKDGARIRQGDEAFYISANTRALLMAERLVLNSMQRMSGIATFSRRYADAVADLPVKVLDTRKTTPLLRFLEKWAVHIGGCTNYRNGLYDWFMIKDNHVDACGGIRQAIEAVNAYKADQGLELGLTVEVRDMDELEQALAAGKLTRIMLDNFSIANTRQAVKRIGGRYEVEASGGITLNTLREVALTGVDFISSGALTHSYRSLDLSLKITK